MSKAGLLVQDDVRRILSNTDYLTGLEGKRLFITGGTGFVGTWLLEVLAGLNDTLQRPCHVDILTRNQPVFLNKAPQLVSRPDFTFLTGDVASFSYPEISYDYVIHAATAASRATVRQNPLEVISTIVDGTRHVLEFARQAGASRVLFVSSGAVYGEQPANIMNIPEDYNASPSLKSSGSAYGEAKRLAEVLCAIFIENYDLSISIARPFTFVGPYQDLNAGFAVTDFMRDGLSGQPLTVNSDGSALRSYGYAADFARDLLTVLLNGKTGATYNIGSPDPVSVLELAERMVSAFRQFNIETQVHVAKPAQSKVAPSSYIPDVHYIESTLGLSPLYSLDDALHRTIAWFIQRGVMR